MEITTMVKISEKAHTYLKLLSKQTGKKMYYLLSEIVLDFKVKGGDNK